MRQRAIVFLIPFRWHAVPFDNKSHDVCFAAAAEECNACEPCAQQAKAGRLRNLDLITYEFETDLRRDIPVRCIVQEYFERLSCQRRTERA